MDIKKFLSKIVNSLSPDLDSIDGIRAIPNKQYLLKQIEKGNLKETILYKLQIKATEHKKNNRIDLSIACLEKAFYIMLESDYFYGDYAYRYIRYLKKDRQFDKARHIERILQDFEAGQASGVPDYVLTAQKLKTDLVEASYYSPCDSETAKYRGRIFSLQGKDKRFPLLTQEIKNCDLDFFPFIYGVSIPNSCKQGEEIEYSNRPFTDDRSLKEKTSYEEQLQNNFVSDNEDEYYWIYEHLPEIAPKSLSGYTRMKNSKSKNFMKIVDAAHKLGYEIKQ